MLIRYETDGKWCPNLTVDERCIVFAVFALDPNASLVDSSSLEGYIRSCEQASHDHWNDESDRNIVSVIQGRLKRQLEKKFKDKTKEKTEEESGLSHFFTEAFLPPFSMSVGKSPTLTKVKTKKSSKKAKMAVVSNTLTRTDRLISLESRMGAKESSMRFVLQSETGSVEPDAWESDTGRPFPLIIKSIVVTAVSSQRSGLVDYRYTVNLDEGISSFSDFSLRVLRTETYAIAYGMILSGPEGATVSFEVSLSSSIPSLSFELKHSTDGDFRWVHSRFIGHWTI